MAAYFNEPYPARAGGRRGVAAARRAWRSTASSTWETGKRPPLRPSPQRPPRSPGRACPLKPPPAPLKSEPRKARPRCSEARSFASKTDLALSPSAALRGRDESSTALADVRPRARPQSKRRLVESKGFFVAPHAGGEAHRRRARALDPLPQFLREPAQAFRRGPAHPPLRRGAAGILRRRDGAPALSRRFEGHAAVEIAHAGVSDDRGSLAGGAQAPHRRRARHARARRYARRQGAREAAPRPFPRERAVPAPPAAPRSTRRAWTSARIPRGGA
jgi:hypothetical protein